MFVDEVRTESQPGPLCPRQALQGLGSETTAERRNEQMGSEHESELYTGSPSAPGTAPAARPRGRASWTSAVLLLPRWART